MKILILGGRVFLGRHLVEAALERGHEVSLFNRGQHSPDLFPQVEKFQGNRDGGLEALEGGNWDAAIDTSGYVPRLVQASAELLASRVQHYTFISSVSVYKDFKQPGITESYPVGTLEDKSVEEVTGETYGPLKALCEQAAEKAMPERVLNVRPGLIVGPFDPTDRFTYWLQRVAAGGEVLAPANPAHQVQFIDVRDLANWIIRLVEAKQTGAYNATGPDFELTMQQVLDECKRVSGSNASFTWVGEEFLLDAGVAPWSEIPLWVPDSDAIFAGFEKIDCNKAFKSGLTFRPLTQTVRDTLNWAITRPAESKAKAGLTPEREAELLQAWHKQTR